MAGASAGTGAGIGARGLARIAAAIALAMGLVAGLAVPSGAAAAKPTPKPKHKHKAALKSGHVVITVLSDRADVISGGEALVAITTPKGTKPSKLHVTVGKRSVSRSFANRPNGRYEGLVTGLKNGTNLLSAVLPDGRGAKITITNHPIGGPVFSGPQIEPWTCQATATDKQCDEPPKFSYLYESTDPMKQGLQPYDPQHPAKDVATTTTDAGVKVPFIVREETGFEDRDEYRTEVLWQPSKPWTPWSPQQQWGHKVLIMHGYDCISAYQPTDPPFADAAGTTPPNSGIEDSSQVALGMGFAVMSTALDNSLVDCNPALQAESLVMAKEHITDTLGEIHYTIGTGCSGGSLAQQWIANAYPGVYQGLIVQCSFPDAGSTGQQIVDYEALVNYFNKAPGWTPAQQAEVEGTASDFVPLPTNASVSASAFFPFVLPNRPGCTGVTAAQQYNAQSNPGGVRCGILDWAINLLGPRLQSEWGAQETAVGHGFAGVPLDNVGVQYGLAALKAGQITPAQFVTVNAGVGGFNVDWQPTPARLTADEPALVNAYRDGIINEANNLNQVAIIDLRGPNDPGLAHDTFRSFATRDRLDRDFGTHANQVIWEGPEPLLGDVHYDDQALVAMNGWLGAVEKDTSSRPLPQRVIADRPANVTDQCSDGNGNRLTSSLCSAAVVPVYGTPRTVAGEAVTTDQNKCQMQPLNRSSYKVSFTDAQWAQLQSIFPGGVCDYSNPGVSQQRTVPWLTYQDAHGKVIYGGRPLGPPPKSVPFRLFSCSRPRGRLTGTAVGPIKLGSKRTAVRSLFETSTTRRGRSIDSFCPKAEVQVGYASPSLLRSLPAGARRGVRDRAVVVVTASRHYTFHGIHPGARVVHVDSYVSTRNSVTIGKNTWFLEANGPSTGMFETSHGRVVAVGIADKRFTRGIPDARRLLGGFS